MSGQNGQKLVSPRRARSRNGSAGSRASGNGKVEHETPRPQAETPSAPPSLCACARRLPADTALSIIRILKELPLPGEVQVVHALNPAGIAINRLRELRVKLVDRAALVSELALRQISDGDGNGQQIACAEVRALLGDLHSACTLAFGWWNSVAATALALKQVAEFGNGGDTQLEAVLNQVEILDPLMEKLSALADALPEPTPSMEDIFGSIFGGGFPGGIVLRIGSPEGASFPMDADRPQG